MTKIRINYIIIRFGKLSAEKLENATELSKKVFYSNSRVMLGGNFSAKLFVDMFDTFERAAFPS